MAHTESHPYQSAEGGFFYRNLRSVAESVGNLALLGIAAVTAVGTLGEKLYDLDDTVLHPLDSDFE